VNNPQIESLVFVSVSALAVVIFALMGVPYLALLAFRIRLAQIRDDTVDAILDKRLRRTAGVNGFLESLTRAAAQVGSGGLSNDYLVALGYQRRYNSTPVLQLFRTDVADLNPAEREMMRELETRARRAYQSLLIAASPVGWLIAPAALLSRRFGPVKQPAHANAARGRKAARKALTSTAGLAVERRSPTSGLVGQKPAVVPDQRLAPTAHMPAATPSPRQVNRGSGDVGLPQQIHLAPIKR